MGSQVLGEASHKFRLLLAGNCFCSNHW